MALMVTWLVLSDPGVLQLLSFLKVPVTIPTDISEGKLAVRVPQLLKTYIRVKGMPSLQRWQSVSHQSSSKEVAACYSCCFQKLCRDFPKWSSIAINITLR